LEEALKQLAREGRCPDVITFAGNGEPTLHPQFAEIIEDTIALRDLYCTGTKVSVLTNATELHRPEIIEALKRVDQNILKLDSGIAETLHRMNQPQKSISPKALAEQFRIFGGTEIIQTMFLKGDAGNGYIDNTTSEELDAWEALVAEVRPSMVMIYTIDRDTPAVNLEKISPEDMEHIADRIRKHGIPVQVSA
jgi:wyosine [tRNA(Phe)-imidazoG37] synthetase (radical SAM superfamily)